VKSRGPGEALSANVNGDRQMIVVGENAVEAAWLGAVEQRQPGAQGAAEARRADRRRPRCLRV
jgi:hypothetical protein